MVVTTGYDDVTNSQRQFMHTRMLPCGNSFVIVLFYYQLERLQVHTQ